MKIASGRASMALSSAAFYTFLLFLEQRKKKTECQWSVHYRNKAEFDKKLQKAIKGGVRDLRCVTDFDFTLTKFSLQGKRGCSCHKIIEDCGLLDKSYHREAQELQQIYYPLEVLPGLSRETRILHMVDWVTRAHRLLIRGGLSKENIDKRKLLYFFRRRHER